MRLLYYFILTLALILWPVSNVAQEGGVPRLENKTLIAQAEADPPTQGMSLLKREIKRFDFEERIKQPYLFHPAMYRVSSESGNANTPRPGFPLFGKIHYVTNSVHSGKWSYKFELDGASMIAAVKPKEINIVPGGDYLITAWVKTDGLNYSKARVTALFYDQHGKAIGESQAVSEMLQTRGVWKPVSLELLGKYDKAASLVIELQLLQPHQFQINEPGFGEPLLKDVRGAAWFDDISVWHLPSIEISTDSPGNIVIAPDQPTLKIAVNDLASEPLNAELKLMRLNGEIVHSETIPIKRGRTGQKIPLHQLDFGWYRVSVEISNQIKSLGTTILDFAYVPAFSNINTNNVSLGINLDSMPITHIPFVVEMIDRLNFPTVVMPIWDKNYTISADHDDFELILKPIESLLDKPTDIVIALPEIPDVLARLMVLDNSQILDVFNGDYELLRPYIQPALIHLGQRVQYWQVGKTTGTSAFWRKDLNNAHEQTHDVLAKLVPGPKVVIPWSAEQTIEPDISIGAYHLLVPYHVQPSWIYEYTDQWKNQQSELLITLQQLPSDTYSPYHRAIDLVMRTLYARRSGVTRLLIDSPWRWVGDREPMMMPDGSLPSWLQLTKMLTDRTFTGEIPMGKGIKAWLFEGDHGSIIVAWNETAAPGDAVLRAQLSENRVIVEDIFGNSSYVEMVAAQHEIPLTEAPVFIQNINPQLARFRQQFVVSPAYAPSMPREHRHELLVKNPWDVAMTGSIKFIGPEKWSFSPTRLRYSIPAGGEARLPFSISFSRSEIAGPKRIETELEFTAGKKYTLRIDSDFEVGLKYLNVQPVWQLQANENGEMKDIIISAYVTNVGDNTLNLEAFIKAPNFSRQKRIISRLDPGETVIKSFHLKDGVTLLAGEKVYIGVEELNGSARLNRVVEIPNLTNNVMVQESSGE